MNINKGFPKTKYKVKKTSLIQIRIKWKIKVGIKKRRKVS